MTEIKIEDSLPTTPEIILNMTKIYDDVYAFTNYGRVLRCTGSSWVKSEDYNWPLPDIEKKY